MNQNHYVLEKRNNGIWYYYIYRYGKRIYRSTGEKTKVKAFEVILERLQDGNLENGNRHHYQYFRDYVQPFFVYETCPIVQDKIQRGGHYSVLGCKTNRLNLENHLLPDFGPKALEEITVDVINRFLRTLPERHGISPQTANKVLGILRQILDQAVREGLIPDNPAKMVKPLVPKKTERGCFTLNQIHAMFGSDWHDIYMDAMVRLAATTGMRMGEIRALCKEQIKDDHIVVDRAWATGEGLKSTKSGHTRIVPVLPEIRQQLLNLPSDGDFVFTYNGSTPISKEVITTKLKKQMEDLKIDYRAESLSFHSFRHFFNTRLVAQGIDAEHIRSVVGHESEQMTEHYLHLTSSDFDEIRKVQRKLFA